MIIGTTLQFPYLIKFINKAKQKGAKIIHINPDESYSCNIRKNERWIKRCSGEGLDELIQEL